MATRKQRVTKFCVDCLILLALGFIDALNYVLLIVHNFIPMGVNGIAVMLEHVTKFSGGWFAWFSLLANLPLCLLTFFLVDKGFAIKTYFYVLVLAVSYLILQKTNIPSYAYYNDNKLITVIMSSVISGVVYGMVFVRNACTGGVDVIGKLVAYLRPQLNFVWVSFTSSAIVAVSSYFVMGDDIEAVFLCIIYCFTASFIGNQFLKGTRSALKVEIITQHAQEISDKIREELNHTTTLTRAQGMYKHMEYDLLICIINKTQLVDIEKILKQYPDTFAYVMQVSSTVGLFNRPGRFKLD